MNRFYCWIRCSGVMVFLYGIGCINARAQTHDAVRAKELDSVLIRSGKTVFALNATTPVQTLSGSRLQQLNSFSVADALRYFSGVQLKDYGGIGGLKTLNVRSLGAQHLGVFYDGLQVGNAQNGIVDLGKFSLDNIDALSLYNSQNTSPLQAARNFGSAAALYIKSKQPVFEPHKNFHINGAFKTGSFGFINPSLHWQQQMAANIASTVSIETVNAHGKYKTRYQKRAYDTTIVRQNADVASQRIELAMQDLEKDAAINWKIQTYFYNAERGLPGAIVAERFYNSQRLWDRNFFTQGMLRKQFNTRYQLLLQGKYANDGTRYLDTTIKKIGGVPLDNRYRQQEYNASLVNEYRVAYGWNVSLATDWIVNKMQANLDNFVYPVRNTGLVAVVTELKRERFTAAGNLLGTFIREKVRSGTAAGDRNVLTPAISASWRPWDHMPISIRSFYKRIFRMPTFNDLYYTIIGSVTLKPEYTTQYDIGLQYKKSFAGSGSGIGAQADVYYNDISNKIIAIPANNLFRWSMINMGKVAVKGMDLQLTYAASIRQQVFLNGTVTYSYQEAVNKTPGERSYDQQIPYAPKHSGSATVQTAYRNWGLNYSFIYTGERYMLPENDPQNYLEPWYTHDLSLTKKFRFKQAYAVLALEVNNLLNQYYDVVVNYPMPGRNYLVKLAFKL
ncbi:TonB-dependent receptor plug domain-containing protein [Niabella drilacis]|uniref:Outer membrane cobalamin receptor protein n=1 Tax=Niabella drilacis (strain DSM 25811 / CCM 8410 / CCUG 62505 / LMG 26954 / E90) TaxID=1285928 RepID=A0A1G7B1Z1_NIADE|nr:TonB-dependent receptor plug domain-containing protein [Niabella drilacis]SDE20940.1 Outer membrane cobalamin receptor protein [Niabella drilacis]